jgi:hypothetical protein
MLIFGVFCFLVSSNVGIFAINFSRTEGISENVYTYL